MNALFYIIQRRIVNTVKEIVHKPGRLLLYVFLFAMMALTFLAPHDIDETGFTVPVGFLVWGVFLMSAIFFFIYIVQGVSSGSTIFEMSDVNFLFVSPISPRKILLYGVISSLKTAVLLSFFILFQGQTITMFGLPSYMVFVLFGLFMIVVLVSALLSIFIYIQTNGNSKRKKIAIAASMVFFIPILILLLTNLASGMDVGTALSDLSHSIFLQGIPIVGWAAGCFFAFVEGNTALALLWLLLLVLGGVGIVVCIMKSKTNYYEDVLVATETSFEKKRAQTEADVQGMSASMANKNIRITEENSGIKGWGASAFFFKHVRETRRKRQWGLVSKTALVMAVVFAIIAFFGRNPASENGFSSPEFVIMTMVLICVWMQMFLVGTSEGLMELYTPNIFMVPASNTSKIIWSNMVDILYSAIDGACLFLLPCLILKVNPLIFVMAILVYAGAMALFISANYLTLRIFGTITSKGLLVVLYMLFNMVILVPGIMGAVFAGIVIFSMNATLWIALSVAMAVFVVWELLLTGLFLLLSRNIFSHIDMPTTQMFSNKSSL